MKKNLLFISLLTLALMFVFNACNKNEEPAPTPTPTPTNQYLSGLGDHIGYPSGTAYNLPAHIQLVSEIRGGSFNKNSYIDKQKYTGPFPYNQIPKAWTSYGTGTFVKGTSKN